MLLREKNHLSFIHPQVSNVHIPIRHPNKIIRWKIIQIMMQKRATKNYFAVEKWLFFLISGVHIKLH